jgi:hypothetical protein
VVTEPESDDDDIPIQAVVGIIASGTVVLLSAMRLRQLLRDRRDEDRDRREDGR